MSCVELRGRLVCANRAEAATIERHLTRHIELTREEPGCLLFEVRPTGDPLVWSVAEKFAGQESFAAHQTRLADSEWGRATAGIKREYTVSSGGRKPAAVITDELDMGPQT
ncbi:putative quinol monooxygenase [Paramicrobacterium fandaimingii]|uniref:putative quinol monooxygenase n=1 Tax=Paramicrobacterium fandaimingii TaxID=2708079 RepID=UPI001422DE31|nr:antibiotic biosynthesis monooxygenase [Microbacterium fandaimingii]